MFSVKPLVFLAKMNHNSPTTRPRLGTDFCDPLGEECKPPTFAPPTKRFRAIDLSCRACDACGALALGAGLGFPVGDLILRFPPPTSDIYIVAELRGLATIIFKSISRIALCITN